jgi:hypothetical protein
MEIKITRTRRHTGSRNRTAPGIATRLSIVRRSACIVAARSRCAPKISRPNQIGATAQDHCCSLRTSNLSLRQMGCDTGSKRGDLHIDAQRRMQSCQLHLFD